MRIDSGVVEPFDFAGRRRPTTHFTRPRTRSSNPVPSTGESVANLTPWSRTIMLLTVKSAIAEDEQAVVACRDLAGPKPFRLLVPISPGCPEAASLCGQTRCWWIGRLMTAVCHLR